MINFALVEQRALRVIKGRRTYQDAFDKQWTVCAAGEYESLPAVFHKDDLEKIRSVGPVSTHAGEISRLDVGTKRCGATVAYQYNNASIFHGYVYKGAMKYPFVDAKDVWTSNECVAHLPDALIASTMYSCRYFGHWITDALTLELAARNLNVPAVTSAQSFYKHEAGYRDLIGLNPLPVSRAQCDQLIIMDDIAANRFKQERFAHIRQQISRKLKPLHSRHGVMLLRKGARGSRFLVNEMEVADFLKSQGFIVIDAETITAHEVMSQVLGAKVVIGVEGSQLTPAIYGLDDSGIIIALQPPDHFGTCHKEYTDLLGMRYGFLVGDPTPDGFKVNINSLAKLLDEVDLSQDWRRTD
jgi:capsular polysaccharide biosynthesis protein